MKTSLAIFCHSLVSDWNHGNAHFLRGIVSELQARGHHVRVFEPEDAWSKLNLIRDHGAAPIDEFHRFFPHLSSKSYDPSNLQVAEWLEGIDLALVHEWNDPALISAIGEYRKTNRSLRLLFHDTHHRAVTAPQELERFDLSGFDGVLAYGASLRDAYQRRGWGKQVYIWHEAADTRIFRPMETNDDQRDLVWVGNWGDEERTEELREYLLEPCALLALEATVFGVRYPPEVLQSLGRTGIDYGGWLANYRVPEMFARFKATVHVPRRPYTLQLPGIPTIRPFEALACGIPLISSPWQDSESLFRAGTDFMMVHNGREMQTRLRDVLSDPELARSLSAHGLETIRNRHTCSHRVDELLHIYDGLKPASPQTAEFVPAEEILH